MQLSYRRYGSVLAAAVARAFNQDIVQLLLDGSADVNIQLSCVEYGSALAAEAVPSFYAKKSLKTVQMLLDAGADVNMKLTCGDYRSALEAAASVVEEWDFESTTMR